MAWRLNKGDWSEAYVFLKLLAEGKISAGNEKFEKIEDVTMEILEISRINAGVNMRYQRMIDYIVAIKEGNNFVTLPITEIQKEAKCLLSNIKQAKGENAYEFPQSEIFLREVLGIANIKEKCVKDDDKTDILLKIKNSNDNLQEEIGFSIKSHLGTPPTLFNYSAASKMVYRIDGCNERLMHYINSLKNSEGGCDLESRMAYIKATEGLELTFLGSKIVDNRKYGMERETGPFFTWNLEHYDANMLMVFDAMLRSDYGYLAKPISKKLSDVVNAVSKENPLRVHKPETVYKAKFKEFLFLSFAGLTASKAWDGTKRINGGYIDVKKDGELLYCRAVSDEKFTNYLFDNMKLERPEHGSYCKYTIYEADAYLNKTEVPETVFKKRNSDKRGDYGYVYIDEGHYGNPCYCIDINFSFRFRN